jgi:hypothetical protein
MRLNRGLPGGPTRLSRHNRLIWREIVDLKTVGCRPSCVVRKSLVHDVQRGPRGYLLYNSTINCSFTGS